MVVDLSVFFKVPLVNTGRYHGLICDLHSCYGLLPVGKGLLDPHGKGGICRALANAEHVAAQIDDGAGNTLGFLIFLQTVGNLAFGDGSQIQSGVIIGKGYCIAVYLHFLISHMGQGGGNLFFGGDDVLSGSKIPEG